MLLGLVTPVEAVLHVEDPQSRTAALPSLGLALARSQPMRLAVLEPLFDGVGKGWKGRSSIPTVVALDFRQWLRGSYGLLLTPVIGRWGNLKKGGVVRVQPGSVTIEGSRFVDYGGRVEVRKCRWCGSWLGAYCPCTEARP